MDDKDQEVERQIVVNKAAAATDDEQAQVATDTAVDKAHEAIKKATAAVQAVNDSETEKVSETASAVSAATAAASAAKAASEAAEAASAVAADITVGTPPAVDPRKRRADKIRRYCEYGRQSVLLIASLVLLYYLTENTIQHGIPLDTTEKFLEVQFWVCIIYIADIIFGACITRDVGRYILNNWLFLLVSKTFLPLVTWYGFHNRPELEFL